jgi:carbamoyl-phosphate synthase large subunit
MDSTGIGEAWNTASLKNDITRETPASFEPSIDYVVTKIPRFAFEKFPQADPTLTTQMKSVGEELAGSRN